MARKSLTIIILGTGVALILTLIASFSSGELVPQERLIETINIGSLPAYNTGSIGGWTCPEKSSDGKQVDRCSISGSPNIGVSLSPGQRWLGYCIAEQSSLAMSLGCSLAGGETMYGNTGYAFGCCAQGKITYDSSGYPSCSQNLAPVNCEGIRNVETSFSATLYESLIQCPDGSYNYRSLCTQAQNTPQTGTIFVTTNLAGASFSISGTSSYSGSGTSWSTTNAPAGTYTITYGTVTGYNAPPSETKTLSASGSITFSGTYTQTQTTGTITVNTNLAGASFTLTGASTYSGSGTSWSTTSAPSGIYTITYGTVTDYDAPPSESKTLASGGSITFSGMYSIQAQQKHILGLDVYDSKTFYKLEGANVYVDNSFKATIDRYGSPNPNIYLDSGSYSVRISKSGCVDASFSVVIPTQDTKYVAMTCTISTATPTPIPISTPLSTLTPTVTPPPITSPSTKPIQPEIKYNIENNIPFKIPSFFDAFTNFLPKSPESPLDSTIHVYVTNNENIEYVELKLTTHYTNPQKVYSGKMLKKDNGHYILNAYINPPPSWMDVFEFLTIFARTPGIGGGTLAPAPFVPESDYALPDITLDEIIVVDIYGNKYNKLAGDHLPVNPNLYSLSEFN